MKVPELLDSPWAMQERTFETLVDCARRGMSMEEAKASLMGIGPEGLRLLLEGQAGEDELDVREDGVAVIPVRGYLTRRSYWRGDRASYEWIGRQFETAMERADVRRIVLEVDSPGGQVNGTEELSSLIYEARGPKPITAYVLGTAASAAYWIASSTDRVIAGRTSMLGSIGVIWTFIDFSKLDEEIGIREISIVSSQSPDKNLDPTTADGRAKVQVTVDQLAGTFVADVARNRGVSEARVVSDFGRGWVLVGEQAVAAGLANSIGRFEEAITDADEEGALGRPQPAAPHGGSNMTIKIQDITAEWLEANCPSVVAGIRAGLVPSDQLASAKADLAKAEEANADATKQGATAERERILGIMGLAGTKIEGLTHDVTGVFDEQIAAWASNPEVSLESARQQYETLARGFDAAAKKQGLRARQIDEATLEVPTPGGADDDDDSAAAAARIKAAGDYAARVSRVG